MTETIKLMKAHTSVRRFKEEEIPQADLEEILTAGQMASSWKNFQSYSVILVRNQEKKDALYELVPQEAIRQSAAFLLFVGDLNRAEKGASLHTDTFQPQGVKVSLSRLWTLRLLVKIPCLQRRVWDMVVLSSVWFATSQKKWQRFLTCLTIPTLFLGLPLACQINNTRSNQDCL